MNGSGSRACCGGEVTRALGIMAYAAVPPPPPVELMMTVDKVAVASVPLPSPPHACARVQLLVLPEICDITNLGLLLR